MTKTIEFIIVATLLIFAFFAGVNYSESVKNHASWLFEPKEEEIDLPDLSDENMQESSPMDDRGNEIGVSPNQGDSAEESKPVESENNPEPQS